MEPFFIKTFWITVTVLWVFLLILYFMQTNRKSLHRKGHQEKYISYLRRSHTIRILIIAVFLPLLMLLSAWIVKLLTGPLMEEVQMAYMVVVLILLVSPLKYLDERINQKHIRKLALETKEKIAVDLNYKILHQIYHPLWETFLGPAAIFYGIFFLRIEQWIIYLFLLFPWFMYFNLRSNRYQTRPYLNDNYKYTFSFNIFNFLFFLLYFCAYFLIKAREVFANNSPAGSYLLLLAGLALIFGLTARTSIYLANYRAFDRAIRGEAVSKKTAFSRKLVFVVSGIVLLISMMGIALLAGLIKKEHIEVGKVHQKFILQDHPDHLDTLLVIDQYYSIRDEEYEEYFRINDVKLTCKIVISTTEQVKTYEVCCPVTFKELPPGQIIKFEYGSGPSILRVIE